MATTYSNQYGNYAYDEGAGRWYKTGTGTASKTYMGVGWTPDGYTGSTSGSGSGSGDTGSTGTTTTDGSGGTGTTSGTTSGTGTTVVAGTAEEGTGQVNVADYAGQLATDPSSGLTADNPDTETNESMSLSDRSADYNLDPNAEGTTIDNSKYTMDADALEQETSTVDNVAHATTTTANQVDPRDAATYQADQSFDRVAGQDMTAAQGQVSQGAIIDPDEVPLMDMEGAATGKNADGTINYTGQALNDWAKQNISTIIDTSTASGKALAAALGEGNYTDSKATLAGQLETLQAQFVDAQGNPRIPAWAAGTARNVSKIAAFKGMSGSAATAAMAQAIMEASIPVAQSDAAFFQTVTLQNLSNKQAQTINKANVLAKFDLTNLDNRMAAAVENAKAFLQMDLSNLDNEQQSRVINTQSRVQSLLEDSKAVNTQRMFEADSVNDMNKFYDELNASISMYNATQANENSRFNAQSDNEMAQFNASAENQMKQFNAEMENNREQFYQNMQYNIDYANAQWRQTVETKNSEMAFEAAATDVKNLMDISQEALNRLWDRSDSLLDYAWKSTENELDRDAAIALETLKGDNAEDVAESEGWGSIAGSIAGAWAADFFS